MTNVPGQQTITPERQVAASQIGAVFNSLHEFLRTLEHKDAELRPLLTKHLEFAHQRIDEAAMWAIKHVLTYGTPPTPKPADAPAADVAAPTPDGAANDAPVADTPPPIGVVDAATPVGDTLSDPPVSAQPSFEGQAPIDNAPQGADALPPTTPTESV